MRCERCNGRGYVPILDEAGVQIGLRPCPDDGCLGGERHCCEGDQACNETTADREVGDA